MKAYDREFYNPGEPEFLGEDWDPDLAYPEFPIPSEAEFYNLIDGHADTCCCGDCPSLQTGLTLTRVSALNVHALIEARQHVTILVQGRRKYVRRTFFRDHVYTFVLSDGSYISRRESDTLLRVVKAHTIYGGV